MITQKRKREELQLLRDEALDAYMNREDFQYDVNADALYRHYKDQYTQLGKRAMQDTMGQAAALTGGYGSSYAQNVGQQAYQSYLSKMDDVIPELYQLAYQKYQDEGNRLYKTYQSWAQLEQQAAQQEKWEREYELEERKRQDAYNQFLLEQERKNSQTQTAAYQPDYWASLAAYHKLGQNTGSNGTAAVDTTTAAEPEYDNGKVSEGNIKTMQRVLGLKETGKWTDDDRTGAGGLTADKAWEYYQKGQLQNYKSIGLSLPIGNIKTMERVLGLEEDGYWSEEDQKVAGGLTAHAAWKDYQQGKLQSRSRSGMSMKERADLKKKQSSSSNASNTKENTPAVQNFISCMVTEDQAAERGVNSTEWKMMVVDRLNGSNMTMYEFEQLEQYYGLDIPGGSSAMPQGNTANHSGQKMSYAEYREKTATQKVSDLNTAVQQYFNDYQLFVNSSASDIQYAGYNNAASMLEARVGTAKELQKQAEILVAALRMNGDIISGDYSELLTQIISAKTGVDSIMDVFEEQARYYSRWDTEDAYNKAVEQAEADKERWTELTGGYDPIANKEEGKAGWEAYVADKEQSAQRAAEAEAKKASEGYSWEQFWDDLGRWMGPGVNPDTSLPFHTDVQLIAQGYRDEEAAKRVPDERWTDEQRYAFGYIWKGSRQKAGDYAYAVNNILNIQQEQEQLQQIKEWSTANIGAGALGTAGAILAAPVGMADFLGDVIQGGTLGYIPEADGQITPFEFSQGVTSGISQHLNTEYGTLNEGIPIIGGKGWGDVYGLGTSIAQSSLAAATGGPGQALITFFGSAAAAGVDDAVSRGASADQAVAYGTMLGLAEALAEMIGVDNIMKIGSSATIKQLVWNILKQGAAEGIEEGVTSVLNNFADNLIMGDKSNFNILVSEYMNQGMDEKDAKKKAWMNMAGDIAFDMLGGFVSGEVHAGPLTSISYVKTQNQYAKTGSSIMDADGGVEALMNLANQVAGVSSAQMQSMLTSQIDKVSQNPTARNIGQLYTTVQAANNQAKTSAGQSNATPQTMTNQTNTSINRADVAESLKGKGIPSQKIDTLAAAIVARVNGQELTRTQRDVLRYELGRPSVQKVINDLIQKKTRGIDSAQSNVYDKDDVVGGLENREEAALWDLAYQRAGRDRSGGPGVLREIGSMPPEAFSSAQRRGLTSEVDVFGDNDYATVMGGSSLYQVRNAFSKRNYESGTDVLDEIKRTGEIVVEFNYNSKYDKIEFARQLADQQKGMKELTVQEYLDNRRKYIEQGRATGSNAAQQAAREKAFADKVDELQDAGLSLKEAEEQAKKWLDTQAVLHIPDQVAGGYSGNVGGVGDKGVNSSIGAQWRYRISGVDAQIQKMAESMSEAEKNTTYLNVKLIFKGE